MPIPYASLEEFKKNARLLKPYTAKGKHGESLNLFAKILGYQSYNELAAADITAGEEPTLDGLLAVMKKLLPHGNQTSNRRLLEQLGVLSTPDAPNTVLPTFASVRLADILEAQGGRVSPELKARFDSSTLVLANALNKLNANRPSVRPRFGGLLDSLVHRDPDSPILASIQQVEGVAQDMLRIMGELAVAACATGVGSGIGTSVARKATSMALDDLLGCYGYLETLPIAPIETLDFIANFGEFVMVFLFRQKRFIELRELAQQVKRLYRKPPSDASPEELVERARADRALTLTLTAVALRKYPIQRALPLLDNETHWQESERQVVNLLRTIVLAQKGSIREALDVARKSALERSVVKLLVDSAYTPESRQLIEGSSISLRQQMYWKRYGFDLGAVKLGGLSKALRLFQHLDELYEAHPTRAHTKTLEMEDVWYAFENQIEASTKPPVYRPVQTTWKFWTNVRTGIRYIP